MWWLWTCCSTSALSLTCFSLCAHLCALYTRFLIYHQFCVSATRENLTWTPATPPSYCVGSGQAVCGIALHRQGLRDEDMALWGEKPKSETEEQFRVSDSRRKCESTDTGRSQNLKGFEQAWKISGCLHK